MRIVFAVLCALCVSAVNPDSFLTCPPQGRGGDPMLNLQKNRVTAPKTYADRSVAQIAAYIPRNALKMHPLSGKRKQRRRWTSAAKQEVAPVEKQGARVSGYLIDFTAGPAETCNCGSTVWVDYHLYLAPAPTDDRRKALVAEITPRVYRSHPAWIPRLRELAQSKAQVRVSGWLMWDEEHPASVGKARVTQWEVHPVVVIEEVKDGEWMRLD